MKPGSTIMRVDLSGTRSGRLTVISFSHRSGEGKSRALYWNCVCDCGGTVKVKTHSLRSGHTQSCGCLQPEKTGEAAFKHGMCRPQTPEHKAWSAMRQRCTNPNDAGYYNYGGRGITVCEQWSEFSTFLADMGYRPTAKHSLERINNECGYRPDNCIWALRKQQCNNTRQNVKVTFNGITRTLKQWSEATGIAYQTLRKRRRLGWPDDRLFIDPLIYLNRGHRAIHP